MAEDDKRGMIYVNGIAQDMMCWLPLLGHNVPIRRKDADDRVGQEMNVSSHPTLRET